MLVFSSLWQEVRNGGISCDHCPENHPPCDIAFSVSGDSIISGLKSNIALSGPLPLRYEDNSVEVGQCLSSASTGTFLRSNTHAMVLDSYHFY